MNKQATFLEWGEGEVVSSPSHFCVCSISRKNIFSTIFHNNPNMCLVHTFPMELEDTIYYLSPDAFCYIVSTLFLYVQYEEPFLII